MTIKKGRNQRDPKLKSNRNDTADGGFVKPSRLQRRAKRGWQRGRK